MFEKMRRTSWRTDQANRVAFLVDGEAYFSAVRAAMLKAKKRIMMIGWDFDTRIILPRASRNDDVAPEKLGDLVLWLVERTPELEIFLLRWDYGALKALFRGTTPLTVLRWAMHGNIHVKLDSAHPVGGSHHQKIMVIDDSLAFCGGIDLTGGRWDRPSHDDVEPGRDLPKGKPHDPWHDASTALEGPIVKVLAKLARDRWKTATGTKISPIRSAQSCWPDELPSQFQDVDVAVARTKPNYGKERPVYEIEALYIDMIGRAKHSIYAESQYFASRKVAEALAARLAHNNCPEIILIVPEKADGWLAQKSMDAARARLYEALRRIDKDGKLRLYSPYTSGGTAIYVHAKIMIIDDKIFRVGSSNLNNRSMRLDSECDVIIDADIPANRSATAMIAQIRTGLIAEHLGCTPAKFDAEFRRNQSLIAAIEKLRGKGKTLRPYQIDDLSAVETYLADNQVLDPEGPDPMFEPFTDHRLFRKLRPAS